MASTRTETRTTRTLSTDPKELNHLVCCREEWSIALCGFDVSTANVNVASDFLCTMCVEVLYQLRPQYDSDERPICPRDGTPCPDEIEIDARIAYETR